MNWTKFAIHDAPQLIGFAIQTVQKIKSAKNDEKEAAVIASAKEGLPKLEAAIGDKVNDAAFDTLLANYIAARVALANFLTKAEQTPPEGVILPKSRK